LKKQKSITVGELEKFLKDKPKDMIVHVRDGIKGYPLVHMLHWKQKDAPIRILLSRSFYET